MTVYLILHKMLLYHLLLLTYASLTTCALRHVPHFPGYPKSKDISINPGDYPALQIDIPIDHYNASDKRTYKNRYWTNSKYYSPGGPVFYFDSGEQNAHPLVPYFLFEAAGPSSVMTLARRFNGLAVLFEHRFYGDNPGGSFPFPMADSGMAKDGYAAYKYLNTEQALQDPVYFAHNFEPPGLEKHWSMLKPDKTPWVWLGGSYPGIRGAVCFYLVLFDTSVWKANVISKCECATQRHSTQVGHRQRQRKLLLICGHTMLKPNEA